ncbi:MAG: response regulator [Burkholderiales bacterium]|nr:response regulator [Burkholderiales bacterium]MBH2017101.1 response regulator [Burkholderiales bacterium]
MKKETQGAPTDGPQRLRRRLLQASGLWLLLVALGVGLFTHGRLQSHRANAASGGQQRLASLQDNVETHFRFMAGLGQVLASQPSLVDFLEGNATTNPTPLTGTQREAFRHALLRRAAVRDMGEQLSDVVNNFQIRQAYIQDAHGTSLADSSQEETISTLGANFRTRDYFLDAMERGAGFQFVMGRISNKPGFNFSARIQSPQRHLGVLILKTDPESMRRLFVDTVGRVLVLVDRNGVVVAGNRPDDILQKLPQAPELSDNADVDGVYRRLPATLKWGVDTTRIGDEDRPVMRIGGRPYLAQSQALIGYPFQVWVMTPLDAERGILLSSTLGGVMLLVLGWSALWAGWRRHEREQAVEQARREALDMTRALPLGLFRYRVAPGGSGRFGHVGPGAAKVFGPMLTEWMNTPERLWGPTDATPPRPPTEPVEFPMQRDGQTRWVSVNSAVATDASGGQVYDGYWLDVTARKRAESRFDLAFENAPNAFLFLHRDKGVLRCNPAAVRVYGLTRREELIGVKPWQAPLTAPAPADQPHNDEQARVLFDRCRDEQQPVRLAWAHTRPGGSTFQAEVTLMSLAQEDPDLYFVIVEDVTLRRETEAALEAARDAAEATARAKSAFLANMSHEIRTPMNAVIGMTHLALSENPPEKVRNYVAKAHHAATNLMTILNDVLDLSKIEAGHLELESVDFDVQQVLDEVTDVLGLSAENKGVELLFSAPANLPARLQGDPTRLRQVLLNLGSNAVKFTDRGSVTLGLDVQEQAGDAITLHGWVRDTGIGMSAEQMARLFQPFTQADASTTRRHGGTGLGLTISRQLVERMGGRMWVDSVEGQGTVFHFTAHMKLPRQATPMAPLRQNWAGKRVLIVDDHPDAREVLQQMATSMGLHADLAASGDEALSRLRAATLPYDWLLLDWKMPGMDGVTLARHIQAQPSDQRPCILLVTAFDRAAALQAAADVRLAGVLTKPVTPSSLFNSLSQSAALNREHGLTEGEGEAQRVRAHVSRATVPASPDPSLLAGTHILLVEDQALNQELARELLERAGARVTLANDGQEALDTLASGARFDCVLMDCQMPRMDGYTATAFIRANPTWATLPIIAMTASALSTDRDQAMAAGMNDHVPKPLDIQQMFATVRRWVQRGRESR